MIRLRNIERRTFIRLRSKEELGQLYSPQESCCLEPSPHFDNVFKENFGRIEYDLD